MAAPQLSAPNIEKIGFSGWSTVSGLDSSPRGAPWKISTAGVAAHVVDNRNCYIAESVIVDISRRSSNDPQLGAPAISLLRPFKTIPQTK